MNKKILVGLSLFAMIGVLLPYGCRTRPKRKPLFRAAQNKTDLEAEILALEKAVKQDGTQSAANKSRMLRLAVLYSHPNNPSPNFKKAHGIIEEYAVSPTGGSLDDIARYLSSIMTEMERLRKLNAKKVKRAKKLSRGTKKLEEKYEALLLENKEMKETIEQLKRLDLQLEKKRREIR